MISSACNAWISNSDSFQDFMRFVLLQHTMPTEGTRASHLDLMLQARQSRVPEDRCLITFEIPLAAAPWGNFSIRQLPLHRLAYLDYTGEIAGNRGFVERVDFGELSWIRQSVNQLEFDLNFSSTQYSRYSGPWRFTRTSEPDLWEWTHLAPKRSDSRMLS